MAQVILFVYNFIFSTTVDFYVGEHLQQTTAGAWKKKKRIDKKL
jgi:hypothetical protein